MNKKKLYTDFISNPTNHLLAEWASYKIWASYKDLPRKKKKAIKRYVEKYYHYDKIKKRISFFNPYLLQMPLPNFMKNIYMLPQISNTAVLRRFKDI